MLGGFPISLNIARVILIFFDLKKKLKLKLVRHNLTIYIGSGLSLAEYKLG